MFEMFSALFCANVFAQPFHEEHYYMLLSKTLSAKCVFLLFTHRVNAVNPSILLPSDTYEPAKTQE